MIETYVEIDIDKIIDNINTVKNINNNSKFCAVIKANGYGLGSTEIASKIEDYVDYFAVARLNEAIVLRRVGIKKPILTLGFVDYRDVDSIIENDIDITIYDLNYARLINKETKGKINCHIGLDTGHSRIGFRENEIDSILKLKKLDNINIISAFSHFSMADEDSDFTKIQIKRFYNIIDQLKDNFNFEFLHLSNSAGAIRYNPIEDMVRVGIAIYGIYPSEFIKNNTNIELKQAFTFKSVVSFVKEIEKNTPISYGQSFISDSKMKIATIPIGYADGYPRALSNIGEVLINGQICKVVGRVCMDQMMVDVSGLEVNIGDEVYIYPDIYKEADKINTIVYDLMTAISIRVPRVYKKNGKIISIDDYLGEIYEN